MSSRMVGWGLLVAGIILVGASGLMLLAPAGGAPAPSGPPSQTPAALAPTASPTPPTAPPTASPTLPPAPSAAATPTPSLAAAEAVRAFIAQLVEALRTGDATFQVARLHPATLERYGEEQCRAELPGRQDATIAITVLTVSEPEAWDYTTDGQATTIEGAVSVDAEIVILGEASRQTLHFAIVDGAVLWFTDCGTPVSATPSP